MGSWAEEQASLIKSADRKAEGELRERIHLGEILRRDSKPFFDQTGQYVMRYVKEFCEALNVPTALRCSCHENLIQVDKESFPNRLSLTLTYCSVPVQVASVLTEVQSLHSGMEERREGIYRFGIDRDGQICLQSMDPDGFARAVLQNVFDAFKSHTS